MSATFWVGHDKRLGEVVGLEKSNLRLSQRYGWFFIIAESFNDEDEFEMSHVSLDLGGAKLLREKLDAYIADAEKHSKGD